MTKTLSIVFNSLRTLSWQKLWRLFKLTVQHPLFTVLGFYATLKCFAIAKELYPKTNSNNGVGNAFRHALWTSLIAMYCAKISSAKKAVDYAKKMTDMHEELFPNLPLEKTMDLHNNAVGISLFQEMLRGTHRQFFETQFFINAINEKVKSAKIIKNTDDDFNDDLVFLGEKEN